MKTYFYEGHYILESLIFESQNVMIYVMIVKYTQIDTAREA